jgi:hypothetical protein
MAKKKKRHSQAAISEAVRANAMQSNVQTYDTDFNPDYSDVIKDLKRIGALALFFFAVLVVLSFFI